MTHSDVIGWSDLMKLGADDDDAQLVARQKSMAINQCATLVYTSGTTGMPKGHDLELHELLQMTISRIPELMSRLKPSNYK